MINKLPTKAIVSGLALVFLVGTTAYAASPATLPTSPLYPVKKVWESLTVVMAASPESKAQKMIDLANIRLAEAKTLAAQAQNNPQNNSVIANTIKESQSNLDQALNDAKQVSDSTKRKELLDEISKEASDNKTEIEKEVEPKTTLEGSDKEKVDNSKGGLDKTSQDAKSSGD